MRFSFQRVVVLTVLFLFVSGPAMAAVAHLKNGDRLTGEVQTMEKGTLKLKTAYAGEVSIDWKEIETLETDKEICVYYDDGAEAKGAAVVADGKAVVLDAQGKKAPLEPERIAAINKKPRDYEFNGNVKAGWDKSEGNTRKESVSAAMDVTYRLDKNRYTAHGDYYWGESKGVRTDYNWLGSAGYDRFLTEKIYANANGLIQQDQFQDLNLRTGLGVGLGYQFFNSDDLSLSAEAGPTYVWEDFISQDSRDYLAGRWAINFKWWAVPKRLQLYHTQIGLVSIEDSNNWIWQSRTGLLFPIVDRFFGSLQYNYDWTNEPAQGKKSDDSRIIFSLGYSFADFPWADDE